MRRHKTALSGEKNKDKKKRVKNSKQLTSRAILVGVPPAVDTRFSAGIIVQSEQVTCGGRKLNEVVEGANAIDYGSYQPEQRYAACMLTLICRVWDEE